MGKYLAAGIVIGGGMIIRSLMTPVINPYWLAGGLIIFMVALFLFIRELSHL